MTLQELAQQGSRYVAEAIMYDVKIDKAELLLDMADICDECATRAVNMFKDPPGARWYASKAALLRELAADWRTDP